MNKAKLINIILNHMKEYEYYNYQDAYSNDDEAYEDINRTLAKDCNGIYEFMLGDFNDIIRYEDIRNEFEKKHLLDTFDILVKTNQYMNEERDKEKNIDI